MSFSSCLANTNSDLFLDASVFINLSASGAAAPILNALPHRVLMVDIAASEVRQDCRNGRSDETTLQKLIKMAALESVGLNSDGIALFGKLVRVLDDGEAATIAAAASRGAIAVLDERKARRICANEFPDTTKASTLDLFSHPAVVSALGASGIADAVFFALANARMHVRADQRDWVVALVGPERTAACKSIPSARDQTERLISRVDF